MHQKARDEALCLFPSDAAAAADLLVQNGLQAGSGFLHEVGAGFECRNAAKLKRTACMGSKCQFNEGLPAQSRRDVVREVIPFVTRRFPVLARLAREQVFEEGVGIVA